MNTFFEELNNRYAAIDFNSEEVHDTCIRELRDSEFARFEIVYYLIRLHIIARDVIRMANNPENLLFGVCTIIDYCESGHNQLFYYHAYFNDVVDIRVTEDKFAQLFTEIEQRFKC
jgi:hypothetical protein